MTLQPRLLPDFAAVPTRRERAAVRAHWRDLQSGMFDTDDDDPEPTCPGCAGSHTLDACPHHCEPYTFDLDQQETTP